MPKVKFQGHTRWFFIFICAGALFFEAQTCKAQWIVFDPTNYAQQLLNYIQQVNTAINTAKMIENQIKSISYQFQNLQNMSQVAASRNLYGLQDKLSQIVNMQNRIRGMQMQYQDFQTAWDRQYKDFGAFNGMSGKDYAQQSQGVLEQTNKATYDAMVAQGLVSQLGDDSANLQSLLAASNTSEGALSAAQAGNAIAALNTQQLIRLQQIVSASYRAQSSYMAQQAQREAMSNEETKRMLDLKPPASSPLAGPGKGQGFKKFNN